VTHIRLSQNHVIDPRALDALVGIVSEAPADANVVVNVGSNGFETLMAYEVENGVFARLAELGHQGGADGDRRRAGCAGDEQGDHGPARCDARAAPPVAERASGAAAPARWERASGAIPSLRGMAEHRGSLRGLLPARTAQRQTCAPSSRIGTRQRLCVGTAPAEERRACSRSSPVIRIGVSPCSGCETGPPSPPFALRSGQPVVPQPSCGRSGAPHRGAPRRPQMTGRRIGCALHMACAGFGSGARPRGRRAIECRTVTVRHPTKKKRQ
jgi:hypothetical protein